MKELSSFIMNWYDNEKREWMSFLLLAGDHYYSMLWKLDMHSNNSSSNHSLLMQSSEILIHFGFLYFICNDNIIIETHIRVPDFIRNRA